MPALSEPASVSPRVVAVLVTWNSAAEVAACLAALAASTLPVSTIGSRTKGDTASAKARTARGFQRVGAGGGSGER